MKSLKTRKDKEGFHLILEDDKETLYLSLVLKYNLSIPKLISKLIKEDYPNILKNYDKEELEDNIIKLTISPSKINAYQEIQGFLDEKYATSNIAHLLKRFIFSEKI